MVYYGDWPQYVSVAERREQAAREITKRRQKGETLAPVQPQGRHITTTFWGKAWCKQLETYSDYNNRLPRGRSYARNGSVIDLQVHPGQVHALVQGSSLYCVHVEVDSLAETQWELLVSACAGHIGSLVELLTGRFSDQVMARMTHPQDGLFPKNKQLKMNCSCPDWATLCKHVAAVLYGVGVRLDEQPELLFVLRKVDPSKLFQKARIDDLLQPTVESGDILEEGDLAQLFGIEMAGSTKSTTQQNSSKKQEPLSKKKKTRPVKSKQRTTKKKQPTPKATPPTPRPSGKAAKRPPKKK